MPTVSNFPIASLEHLINAATNFVRWTDVTSSQSKSQQCQLSDFPIAPQTHLINAATNLWDERTWHRVNRKVSEEIQSSIDCESMIASKGPNVLWQAKSTIAANASLEQPFTPTTSTANKLLQSLLSNSVWSCHGECCLHECVGRWGQPISRRPICVSECQPGQGVIGSSQGSCCILRGNELAQWRRGALPYRPRLQRGLGGHDGAGHLRISVWLALSEFATHENEVPYPHRNAARDGVWGVRVRIAKRSPGGCRSSFKSSEKEVSIAVAVQNLRTFNLLHLSHWARRMCICRSMLRLGVKMVSGRNIMIHLIDNACSSPCMNTLSRSYACIALDPFDYRAEYDYNYSHGQYQRHLSPGQFTNSHACAGNAAVSFWCSLGNQWTTNVPSTGLPFLWSGCSHFSVDASTLHQVMLKVDVLWLMTSFCASVILWRCCLIIWLCYYSSRYHG